jgi:hypothetical protein
LTLEILFADITITPWLTKRFHVDFTRLAFLFGVRDEAGEVGKSSRIATTGAIAYQWLPLLICLLSKAEVAPAPSGIVEEGVRHVNLAGQEVTAY